MNRRDFLQKIGFTAAAGSMFSHACKSSNKPYQLSEYSSNAATGHLLRKPFVKPEKYQTDHTDILIVGAGISALSACRVLEKNSARKIKIIELSEIAGGNATAGKNIVSAFPWASHYLPIPGLHLTALIDFLKESNIITGMHDGLPVYHEDYICHDNKERLYINGKWQKGIIPDFNIPQSDKQEIARFVQLTESWKQAKGNDGRYVFDIPLYLSSNDFEDTTLNAITAKQWLEQENFTSDYLHWYINYCTSDDYGSSLHTTSAWAMLHYFSSRRGIGANVNDDDVLTWPEGNFFLTQKFLQQIKTPVQYHEMALHVTNNENGKPVVFHFNTLSESWTMTTCEHLILNTPFYVAKKLYPAIKELIPEDLFHAYPWIVANITLQIKKEKPGMQMSWDNVIYNTGSLGFIHATHQSLNRQTGHTVLTYYKVFNQATAKQEREALYNKTLQQIGDEIIQELEKIYPKEHTVIESIVVKRIGHGMVSPTPGLLFSADIQTLSKPLNNVHLCHTDYCGISIFEEAFYKGLQTAESILNT